MHAAAGKALGHFVLRLEALQPLLRLGDHGLEIGRRHVTAAKALGQRHDADGQRGPGDHAVLRVEPPGKAAVALAVAPREVQQDELRGAAADVEHEDEVAAWVDERRRAGHRQPRLHLGCQDLDLEAEPVADAREELSAVLGDAAGFRGDEARAPHLGAAELGGADLERIQRARHGGFRQPPRLADALAEADNAREGIDDAEAAARRAGEQQAAVVGAEVERAVNAVGTRVASLARGRRDAVGAAVVMSDGREMGVDGGKIAAAGSGLRRSGGAALVGIALHSSSSSAWHLAISRKSASRPRHQASSG